MLQNSLPGVRKQLSTAFLVVVFGLLLGEYSENSAAAGLLVLGLLGASAALDEAGFTFAGAFRRLLLVSS